MKLLTLNFLTCAIKTCKSSPASFPLHTKECTLEKTEIAFQPAFMRNILPRLDMGAMRGVCMELGLGALLEGLEDSGKEEDAEVIRENDADAKMEGTVSEQERAPSEQIPSSQEEHSESTLQKLHTLLLETGIKEGKLVCGNCGFEYPVKEGVGNFLLPSHLV
jgi:multifunctional methyltransferase subunit TRM112